MTESEKLLVVLPDMLATAREAIDEEIERIMDRAHDRMIRAGCNEDDLAVATQDLYRQLYTARDERIAALESELRGRAGNLH